MTKVSSRILIVGYVAIYVDVNLANNVRGEEVARRIHDLGFTDIYLATGYDADGFPPLPYIKAVVGKDFPLKL